MKHIVLWMFFSLLCNFSFSQSTISGRLSDKDGKSISGASVVLYKSGTDSTLAYTISDSKGFYRVNVLINEKKIQIKVRSIGFTVFTKTISNQSQTLNIELEEKSVELKEIVIKDAPITRRGDTINYQVNAFAKEQDRSIADVLKRMPGIDVLDDGKVLYQGRPINKYYIEGLDLLAGKYNLANNNLPYKEVTSVQILENHQPIKILDSIQFSNLAALNIKLKNAYTFTGSAEAGVGTSPLLWKANITPMLFARKYQMLASYQTNNLGDYVAAQVKTLSLEDFLEQFENYSQKQDWLGIQQLSHPAFSEKRWLDNNVHLATGNYLQKLKRDYELRLNSSYLNDFQIQKGYTRTLFFVGNDTISLDENKQNQLHFSSLETNLTLQRNTKDKFLKNTLNFQGFWDGARGNILTGNEQLNQNLSNHYFKVSNALRAIFPLGKKLMTFNSSININRTPQSLQVNPGQFQDLLNNGNWYSETFQTVNLQTFYTNNSVGFTKGWKRFAFSPKIGFLVEKQKLKSRITTSENHYLGDDFNNNLSWNRTKAFVDLLSQYKKNKMRVELRTPFSFQTYKIEDAHLHKQIDVERLILEPSLSFNYEVNSFWKLNTSLNRSNQFGKINQFYYAFIMQNYRNIQQLNLKGIPHTLSNGFNFGISYRNPLKTLFAHFIYAIVENKNNLLLQTNVLNNGAVEINALDRENYADIHNISFRVSKYLSSLKSNFTVNGNYGIQDFKQILNRELVGIKNQTWSFGGKIETDFTKWFNTEFQTNWLMSKNKIKNKSNNTIVQQNYLMNLNFYPQKSQYIGLKTEYLKNNLFNKSSENIFMDIVYRYTWQKNGIDLEFHLNNLFNTNNYQTINIDSYSYIETSYTLRPRQVFFKAKFAL